FWVGGLSRWVWSLSLYLSPSPSAACGLRLGWRRDGCGRLPPARNLGRQPPQGETTRAAEAGPGHDRKEHGPELAHSRAHLQAGSRARSLETGSRRPLCALEDLSDLPLVRRPRAEGARRRPPGAGRFLHHLAGADEPAVGLLSLLQHRLSQRL